MALRFVSVGYNEFIMSRLTTRNPFSGELLESYPCESHSSLQTRLDQAEKSYLEWSCLSLADRVGLLKRVRNRLLTNLELHARLITSEMGKPIRESRSELHKCLWLMDYFLEQSAQMLLPRREDLGEKEVVQYLEATGAVLGIMPWNFPYWQVIRFAIPTLLLGNIVILKHAPLTTGCGLALQALFENEQPGIFQTIVVPVSQVEQVIAHRIVQGVCLTGSAKAGKAVASLAGAYLKKSVLELGGADAFVVLKDAELEKAMNAAFLSRTLNAGQSCIAAKRIFVHRSQLGAAQDILKDRLSSIVQGDPLEEDTTMGPLSSIDAARTLLQQQQRMLEGGGRLIHSGTYDGTQVGASLIVAEATNPLNQEELFGPILTLIPWDHHKELIRAVNNSPFGLGGSVWGNDQKLLQDIAHKMKTGAVALNSMMSSDPRIPFGGIRKSGYGREMGQEGLKSFANMKVLVREKQG